MKRSTALAAIFASLTTLAGPAVAQSQGDWLLGIGVGYVSPKSNNGTIAGASATVGDDTRPIFTAEYFFRDNLGVELLAAAPFKHTISLNGTAAATVKQLPPTLSLNYYFQTQSAFTPFVGVGVNYTTFFDETSALGTVRLKDSWGVALKAGADYAVSDNGRLRLDLRWMDIDTDVTLNGASVGTAEIDPLVVSFSYVHRF